VTLRPKAPAPHYPFVTPARAPEASAAERHPCPACGTAYAPSCPRATPPSHDPTRGVQSTDRHRHPYSPAYRRGA